MSKGTEYILLGSQYESGTDVPRNTKKAIEYYQLAADSGVSFGLECIGCVLFKEAKTPEDFQNAYKYLISASKEERSACTTFALAEMYRNGQYVKQDKEKAIDLYWSILNDDRFVADDYYASSEVRLIQLYDSGIENALRDCSFLELFANLIKRHVNQKFTGSGIGGITEEEYAVLYEKCIRVYKEPVDTEARWKDYTIEVTVHKLPIDEDNFAPYYKTTESLQTRTDASFEIQLQGEDDPSKILIAYGKNKYYVEFEFPMDDYDYKWEHPLVLARDGLNLDDVAQLLWEKLVLNYSPEDIPLFYCAFGDWTSKIYPEFKKADLEDGKLLKKAIGDFHSKQCARYYNEIINLLRDSEVWLVYPAMTDDLLKITQDLVEINPTTKLMPLTCTKDNQSFLPVFTNPVELGDSIKKYSIEKKTFLEAIDLAVNDGADLKGIIIDPFTGAFVIENILFEKIKNAKSRLKD